MKTRLILLFCIATLLSCKPRFNPDDWKANKNRAKQIDQLVRSNILIGKSYVEVVDLLGTEDLPKSYDSIPNELKFRIQYLTGGGQMIDFERLLIAFDSGKVITAEKYYD